MASYREHLAFSTMLGVGTGAASIFAGFTPVQGVLAGCFTGIGGILPDLDSESGRPVREVFGLTAAMIPVLLVRRLQFWGGTPDGTLLLAILVYVTVRYGGMLLLGLLAVHRGMFHSLPAMLITGEITFLAYHHDSVWVKLLMALGIMLGFFSHLLLDEIYAVQWNGLRLKANKFSGSAVKFIGKSWPANIFTYGLLFTLGFGILEEQDQARIFTTVAPSGSDSEMILASPADLPVRRTR